MELEKHTIDCLAQPYWHKFCSRFGEMVGLDRENRTVHVSAT
jgi:NADH:ubiquinone reductase (H+-translocating)